MREANISVSDSAFAEMGIEELLSLTREAGVREFEELACQGNSAVVQATVETRYDENRLSALQYVESWEHVSETDNGHLYVIAFTAPDLPERLAEESEDLVGTCDPELGERSADFSLVGSQESISGTIREYEAAGVSPNLEKLGSYEGGNEPTDVLTDRQREVIQTAFDMGYYEVPRETSTEEIAEALNLDDSTVAEHLQRAERNLLGQFFN